MWALAAAPASADPPERFEEPFAFFFPDFESGKWVFINIDRGAFCDDDGFLGTAAFQVVTTPEASILRVSAPDAQAWLYEITGALPEDDDREKLCESIGSDPVGHGTVNLRANDNETPTNDGPRANSFGNRAQGTLDELNEHGERSGRRYHLSLTVRTVIPPGESFDPEDPDDAFDPTWTRAFHSRVHLVGAAKK